MNREAKNQALIWTEIKPIEISEIKQNNLPDKRLVAHDSASQKGVWIRKASLRLRMVGVRHRLEVYWSQASGKKAPEPSELHPRKDDFMS